MGSAFTLSPRSGRVNVLTQVERRLACLAIIEAAVATATPVVVYQALLKLVLATTTLLCSLGSGAAASRWCYQDGTLIKAGRRTLLLVGTAGALAFGVGSQAQGQTETVGMAYPVNTYGAAVLIFASVGLLLWLTRLVAGTTPGAWPSSRSSS